MEKNLLSEEKKRMQKLAGLKINEYNKLNEIRTFGNRGFGDEDDDVRYGDGEEKEENPIVKEESVKHLSDAAGHFVSVLISEFFKYAKNHIDKPLTEDELKIIIDKMKTQLDVGMRFQNK